MGSNFLSPPAKRSMMSDPNSTPNKRPKSQSSPLPVPVGHVFFRLLCHASRVGGVIGKSGAVIKQLQLQTGSKIRVEDAPPDCPDRVVTVIGPSAEGLTMRLSGGEEVEVSKGQEALVRVFERVLEVAAESEGAGMTAAAGGVVSCRMLAEVSHVGAVIGKGGKVVEKIRKDCGVKVRVLNGKLPSCANSTEEVIEIEGGVLAVKKALVSVSSRLQDCQPVDKIRMIGGSKSVEEVHLGSLPEVHIDILSQRNSLVPTVSSTSISYASGTHPLLLDSDRVVTPDTKTPPKEVVFRILCSNDRIGGVIGKGGNIIKALQNETGASITIGATMVDCDERLITITASENPESRYSAAQQTVVLVFSRSADADIETGSDSVNARLVVSRNQVGCLLGKGGNIVSEMRRITGAGIKIMSADQVPKCVPENDQVVQISGNLVKVKDAIYHVTGRLRDNHFSSLLSTPGKSTVLTETSSYGKLGNALKDPLRDALRDPLRDALRDPIREPLREPFRVPLREPLRVPLGEQFRAPLGEPFRAPLGEPFRAPLGEPFRAPLGESLRDPLRVPLEEPLREYVPFAFRTSTVASGGSSRHTTLTQGLDHLGLSSSVDHPSPPRLWASQKIAGVNSRYSADVSRALSSSKGGSELGSGNKCIIVTNTTVEIVVPENVVGSVYGENGSNLARLRQISGAKIIVHEPRLGTTDRIVVISGTPDETQAAQSLLQAFILTGKS